MASTKEIHAKRPTSPHLGIYKPQISSTLSILHRITGVVMFLGLAVISWWLIIVEWHGFCDCLALNHSLLGKLVFYGVSYSTIYHFFNGIRHLFWDMGYGFSIQAMNSSGWIVVMLSIILTIILWGCIL